MEAQFPDVPGLSGMLFAGQRRRPGSPAGPGSIEEVHAVAVKLAYAVTPATDPAQGSLGLRADGPALFEGDQEDLRYESDLVPEKPEGDLIVIADALPMPLSVTVDGVVRMSQAAIPVKELAGLAWEDRLEGPRSAEGGDFAAMTQALPDAFQNVYYNGYRRDRRQGGAVPHLAPGGRVAVSRDGGGVWGFTLPLHEPALTHAWYVGEGVDDPALWKSRSVPMALDTLVMEPDRGHAYAVWRAVWPKSLDPDGRGATTPDRDRRLTVSFEGD